MYARGYRKTNAGHINYYSCSKTDSHKFMGDGEHVFLKIHSFPEDMTFLSDTWEKDAPKIQDTFSSLEDDREELKNLLVKFSDICQEILVLEEKHKLYIFSELGQSIRYKGTVDIPEILKQNVDTKLWDIVFSSSGIERFVTATEAAKLKEKYLKEPPVYTANAARELVKSVDDNSGQLVHATLQKIFDTITNTVFYAGNTRLSEKQMKNERKIEQKFRFSWMSSLPEHWIEDRHYAIFCDLEMGCAIVSEKPVPVYPNRIMDSMGQNLRRGIQEYQNDFFKVKIFKNGNAYVEILDKDVVDKLNRWGSKGNTLPPPV